MINPDKLYYDLCTRFMEQSTCRTTNHGAIITLDGKVVAQGWNSPPKGSEIGDCPRCNNKDKIKSGTKLELAICVHAEVNAIGSCAKYGPPIKNGYSVLYTLQSPCAECAKLIVTVGINEVVFEKEYPSVLSISLLKRGNVKIRNFFKEDYL